MILQVWWHCEVSFSWTTYFTFVLEFLSLWWSMGASFFVLLMSFVGTVLSIAFRTFSLKLIKISSVVSWILWLLPHRLTFVMYYLRCCLSPLLYKNIVLGGFFNFVWSKTWIYIHNFMIRNTWDNIDLVYERVIVCIKLIQCRLIWL